MQILSMPIGFGLDDGAPKNRAWIICSTSRGWLAFVGGTVQAGLKRYPHLERCTFNNAVGAIDSRAAEYSGSLGWRFLSSSRAILARGNGLVILALNAGGNAYRESPPTFDEGHALDIPGSFPAESSSGA